jgi:hypothetical protein
MNIVSLAKNIEAMKIAATGLDLDNETPMICYGWVDSQGEDSANPIDTNGGDIKEIILDIVDHLESGDAEIIAITPYEKA